MTKDPILPKRDNEAFIVKVENGSHFVYLPCGEKIPGVISTTVSQYLLDQPICKFTVLYNASPVIDNKFIKLVDGYIVLPSGNLGNPSFVNILETESNEIPRLELTVRANLV